jgi:hypothetical protein
MKNKHKISGWVDGFYQIVKRSSLFWWTLLKHICVYGVLDGLYAMKRSSSLKLEKKQLVSFCWAVLVVLTLTSFLLISQARAFMAVIFMALLILTSLATIYMYEIVELVSANHTHELSYQVIYAQAFLNIWQKFVLKFVCLILGLFLLKLNLILFIFVFPKGYQVLLVTIRQSRDSMPVKVDKS